MYLDTKEKRNKVRDYEFNRLVNEGYIREDYKNTVIFHHPEQLLLKTFKGNAANHSIFFRYRSLDSLLAKIEEVKKNTDSLIEFKAKRKEENKGRPSSHAAAAASIKAELSKKYPGIKFSCKSDSFSMGDSVDVYWSLGPCTSEVDNIIGKYQYGHFNGMEDIYENTNWRDDIPQSKYVSSHRSIPADIKEAVRLQMCELMQFDEDSRYHNSEDTAYKLIEKTDFPATYESLKVVRNSENCACGLENLFNIEFVTTEQLQKSRPEKIETSENEIKIIEYSDLSIAVVGKKEAIEPIRAELKRIGASFNFRLTCGPGWILPKRKLDQLTEIMTKYYENV